MQKGLNNQAPQGLNQISISMRFKETNCRSKQSKMFPIFLLILLSIFYQPILAFSGGQWAILATHPSNWVNEQRQQGPKCLDIPENFTLCHGMQYKSMRLPNLLEHESLDEAIQQSQAWVSLLRLHCHFHTKLFLCSLFAPICLPQLDRPIQPCQSLCRAVQEGCAVRMEKYGFPWPSMLNCSQFPADGDLCIKPPPEEVTQEKHTQPPSCKSCAQVATFENLMDNFCRSSTVLKVRLRPLNSTHMAIQRKMRVFKSSASIPSGFISAGSRSSEGGRRRMPRHSGGHGELIRLAEHGEGRCKCPFAESHSSEGIFLVMASERRRTGTGLNAKLVVPWKQEKAFKAAIRRFKKVNCSTLGREIRESVLSQMFRRRAAVGP